jgi:hypothetical protein
VTPEEVVAGTLRGNRPLAERIIRDLQAAGFAIVLLDEIEDLRDRLSIHELRDTLPATDILERMAAEEARQRANPPTSMQGDAGPEYYKHLADECRRCHHHKDEHYRAAGFIDPCRIEDCDCDDLDLTGWSQQ